MLPSQTVDETSRSIRSKRKYFSDDVPCWTGSSQESISITRTITTTPLYLLYCCAPAASNAPDKARNTHAMGTRSRDTLAQFSSMLGQGIILSRTSPFQSLLSSEEMVMTEVFKSLSETDIPPRVCAPVPDLSRTAYFPRRSPPFRPRDPPSWLRSSFFIPGVAAAVFHCHDYHPNHHALSPSRQSR